MTAGDKVIVTVNGKSFTGRVKFASDSFVSVDQGGGVAALIRRDANSNSWLMGKMPASFAQVETFRDRLERTYKEALQKFNGKKAGWE